VVVGEGDDPNQALAEAGISDPVAIPVVFGENTPDAGFGDGITANPTAVLEPDQEQGQDQDAGPPMAEPSGPQPTPQSRSGTSTLPPAYGTQPLAPIAGSGSARRTANGAFAAKQPPNPMAPAEGSKPHGLRGARPRAADSAMIPH
jgi:hypothetical protein